MGTQTSCSAPACAKRPHAYGLCWQHYMEVRAKRLPRCSVKGCGRDQHSSGLCTKHYVQERRRSAGKCVLGWCGRPAYAFGLCKHHRDNQLHGEPFYQFQGSYQSMLERAKRRCAFEGCTRPIHGKGFCRGHWGQVRFGRPLAPLKQYRKRAKPPVFFEMGEITSVAARYGEVRARACARGW